MASIGNWAYVLKSKLRHLEPGSYIEAPVFHGDIGYVTEGPGSIHQIRNKTLRVLRPVPDGKSRQNVEIRITPKP